MRVLLLSPGRFAEGGAERSATLLVANLVARGHEVRVLGVAGTALPVFGQAGAQTAVLGSTTTDDRTVRHATSLGFAAEGVRSVPRVAAAVRALTREVRAFRPDVVYSNGARTHVLSIGVPTRAAVVWALRDVPPLGPQTALLRTASRRTSLLLANSAFTREHYRTRGVRAEVVGNPVEPVVPQDRAAARHALSLPLDRPILGLVAHLHPSKGHHIALQALAAWRPEDRPFLALAGGENYPGSAGYRVELLRSVASLGLSRDVALLGSLQVVDTFYSAVDVLVHPPVHPEGFGRTVVEAQSAGLPVVASDLGGVAELCRDHEDALLVPPGDPVALHRAVEEVLTSPDLRAALVAAGRERAARFAPEHHVAQVERLLLEVSRP